MKKIILLLSVFLFTFHSYGQDDYQMDIVLTLDDGGSDCGTINGLTKIVLLTNNDREVKTLFTARIFRYAINKRVSGTFSMSQNVKKVRFYYSRRIGGFCGSRDTFKDINLTLPCFNRGFSKGQVFDGAVSRGSATIKIYPKIKIRYPDGSRVDREKQVCESGSVNIAATNSRFDDSVYLWEFEDHVNKTTVTRQEYINLLRARDDALNNYESCERNRGGGNVLLRSKAPNPSNISPLISNTAQRSNPPIPIIGNPSLACRPLFDRYVRAQQKVDNFAGPINEELPVWRRINRVNRQSNVSLKLSDLYPDVEDQLEVVNKKTISVRINPSCHEKDYSNTVQLQFMADPPPIVRTDFKSPVCAYDPIDNFEIFFSRQLYASEKLNINLLKRSIGSTAAYIPEAKNINISRLTEVVKGSLYKYTWNPSGGNEITSGGDFEIFISGSSSNPYCNNGTLKYNFTIDIPDEVSFSDLEVQNPIKCFGVNDGVIKITASGGSGDLQYSIDNKRTWSSYFRGTTTISNRAPGTYKVWIRDSNGCIDQNFPSREIVLSPKTKITHIVSTNPNDIVNPGKPLATDGSIKINSVRGGTLTNNHYRYTILLNGSSTNVLSGTGHKDGFIIEDLPKGNHKIRYIDANKCTSDIYDLPPLRDPVRVDFNLTKTDAYCFEGFGKLNVSNISGGYEKYTVLIKKGSTTLKTIRNISRSSTISENLKQGTYVVTVKDARSGELTKSITINQEDEIVINNINVSPVKCNGGKATITVSATGGQDKIVYEYGIYEGGTIKWQSNNTFDRVASTIGYRFKVRNKNIPSCESDIVESGKIEDATEIFINSIDINNNNIFRENEGSIRLNILGGKPAKSGYVVSWKKIGDNRFSGAGSFIDELTAGKYIATIKDSNMCTITSNEIEITEPKALSVNVQVQKAITCNGDTGILKVNASGGKLKDLPSGRTESYKYQWYKNGSLISGATNATYEGTSGNYYVTVFDSFTSKQSTVLNLVQPKAITFNLNETDITCNDVDNGKIKLTISGGNGTYEYAIGNTTSFNPITTLNNNTIEKLSDGTFQVYVKDASGCIVGPKSVQINRPSKLTFVSESIVNNQVVNESKGSVTVNVTGGSGNYNYEWTSDKDPTFTGTNSPTISSLPAAKYTVKVTDKINSECSITAEYEVKEPKRLSVVIRQTKFIECFDNAEAELLAVVSGGFPINSTPSSFEYKWYKLDGGTSTFLNSGNLKLDRISGLKHGTYKVDIKDSKNVTTSKTISISQPSQIKISLMDKTDVFCFEGSNGEIKIDVQDGTPFDTSGGAAAYSYKWIKKGDASFSSTNKNIQNLKAGEYYVEVTDKNLCTQISPTFMINQPAKELKVISAKVNDLSGFEKGDGSILIEVDGGTTTDYKYEWRLKDKTDIVSTEKNLENAKAGTYQLTLTNENCTVLSDLYTVNQPDKLIIDEILQIGDIKCNGDESISLTSKVSGGVKPYTYKWVREGKTDILGTTFELKDKGADTYVLTVLDDKGNSTTKKIVVNQPPLLEILNTDIIVTDVSCHGGDNGTIKVTATGGVGDYSYSWNNGTSGDQINNLKAGEYTVTVRDKNLECKFEKKIVVNEPKNPLGIKDKLVTDTKQFGSIDGAISIEVEGGTPPYTYKWFDATNNILSSTTKIINNLAAGDYTVIVTDAKGCKIDPTYTVEQPKKLEIKFNKKDITCNGQKGFASANVTGGVKPYTYFWTKKGEGLKLSEESDILDVSGGTYVVKVTDKNKIEIEGEITIIEPPVLEILDVNIIKTEVSCFGGDDGTIKVTATGGVGDYSYRWDNGATGDEITKLKAGEYTVTVIDKNLVCEFTKKITITQPSEALSIKDYTTTMTTGFGKVDGTISIEVNGGTSPYTYQWKDESDVTLTNTTANLTGVKAGDYTVQITDDKGCSIIETYTVDEPDELNIDFNKSDISCFGEKVNISAHVKGGVKPYFYSWNKVGETIELSNTSELLNISGGTYLLKIEDKNGNRKEKEVTIIEPSQLEIDNVSTTDATCYKGSDGAIVVNVKGGVTPYSYKWAHSSVNTNTLNNIEANTYNVTITDNNGCFIQREIVINQPEKYAINNVKLSRPTSDVVNDGDIEVIIIGGEAPYNYVWKDDTDTVVLDETTNTKSSKIENLSEGMYSITITDAKNCIITEEYNLANPGELLVSVEQRQEIFCHGESNAILDVVTIGGALGNRFKWYSTDSSTVLGTDKQLKGIPAGDYYVIVSNAEGIEEKSSIFTVTQPEKVEVSISQINANCFGTNDASFKLDIKGGTGTYEYRYKKDSGYSAWNVVTGNTATVSDLVKGTYEVQVRDINNCLATDTTGNSEYQINITEPTPLKFTKEEIANVSGFGLSNGTIEIEVTGGTPNYNYKWFDKDDSPIGTNATVLDNLIIGKYKVIVEDNNGCSITQDFEITQPEPLEVSINQLLTISCLGSSDGSLEAVVKGGVKDYKYKWYEESSTIALGTESKLTDLAIGNYYVIVEDKNGNVERSKSFELTEPKILETALSSEYTSCGTGNDWTIISNTNGGTPPYRYIWSSGESTADLNNVTPGLYEVTVVDARGCSTKESIRLTPPPELKLTKDDTINVTGFGLSNGSITVELTGGTPDYTYQWLDADGVSVGTNATVLDNISAGKYQLVVEDSKGCRLVEDYEITQPDLLEVSLNQVSIISCLGTNNGSLEAIAIGGVKDYQYSWYKEGSNRIIGSKNQISNLDPGKYYVIILDAKGNTVRSSNYEITEPEALELNLTSDYTLCGTGNDWTVTTAVKGGTSPYRYIWNTGSSDANLTDVLLGTYEVTIVDANGCSVTEKIELNAPPELIISGEETNDPKCFNGNNGTIKVEVSGGLPPYTYEWNNGSITSINDNLTSGTYEVIITDSKGCKISKAYVLNNPEKIEFSLGDDVTLCKDQTYVLNATIDKGVSYEWSSTNGLSSTERVIEVSEEGVYSVVITNEDGCIITDDIEIKRSKDDISSNFFVSSIAFVNEPVVAVNVSDPAPEESEWILPVNAKLNETTKEYVEFYFEEAGEYEITLYTKKGECEAFQTKTVFITEKEIGDDTASEEANDNDPIITDFNIYPNPSSGVFALDLELKEESDVSIKIYSLLSNDMINYKKVENNKAYKIDYNLNMVPGLYFVLIETQNEKLVKKIIIR
ncbi:T9SS type A sorting domain-containing protein [Tenacibaculum jejuense]|uniref:Secretion system C-terminal sorting domain-containing protein n=1 Tax=Tenacibaculum jejuense TaxID=584609 RepID=A0A238UBZ4_9FLAO|nr:T9SS type A sorting domain-containing protein [Tenacibaculum jejuense]SNR15994.1 Protein of unknown function precursor containing a C-terminal secretion signal. Putative adhesin [Tenacibaculum jejuense]